MDLSLNIFVEQSAYRRKLFSLIILFIISLLIATFLRISLLVLYPFVALVIAYYYKFRASSSLVILAGIVAVSFTLSFFGPFFLKYKLLSLFYMLPFLLLLFGNPQSERFCPINHLKIFFRALTVVALANDVAGLIQVVKNPHSDDSFIGFYSDYSISINGLMLINAVLFYYYYACFNSYRKLKYLIPSLFFLCCSALGYYGAGLIVVSVAFVVSFLRLSTVSIIKTAAIGGASIALIYVFLYTVKPLVLEYNLANIKKIIRFDEVGGARKVKSFYNYGTAYPENAKDFIFGSGPGTFNSRSAFMVGSPSYFQLFPLIKDDDQPYYFKYYAYTLWNAGNTQKELYLDGFRNQPFSSVLAFLGEYGLLFFVVFLWLYYRYYKSLTSAYRKSAREGDGDVALMIFKFLAILLPLLLLIDNYYEYPEIMLLILIGMKMAQIEMNKRIHPIPHPA